MKFSQFHNELVEAKKLRNVLTDAEMEKSMKKALADKANWKGGKVNWNFIDADMYMELTAKGYDLRAPSIDYMNRFDKLADKLDPESVNESEGSRLTEGTLNFNLEDYSGKKIKVTVDEKKGKFKTSGWMEGTFKTIADGVVEVTVKDYEHAPLTAYKLDGKKEYWYAEDSGISRDGKHPIEAALKLASNIF